MKYAIAIGGGRGLILIPCSLCGADKLASSLVKLLSEVGNSRCADSESGGERPGRDMPKKATKIAKNTRNPDLGAIRIFVFL